MFDPTFGDAALSKQLKKGDFLKTPALKNEAFKQSIIVKAVATAKSGFLSLPLDTNDLAGRTIYQVNDLPSDLVLRKAAQNIRRITGAKQGSRMEIVRRLKLLCEEGMAFTVAKLDIKNFYSSIDQDVISRQIQRRLATAPSTRGVLTSFLAQCKRNAIRGLPPGLAVSAELSEFYMQDFDHGIREALGAHYFARYVDDIILVLPELDGTKNLRKQVDRMLPQGLKLNLGKTKMFQFGGALVKSPNLEHSFDYLGYKFSVFECQRHNDRRPHDRRVELDIAESKVKKNKTRICRSLLQYLADGSFEDLRDRVRILTSGYQFFDERQSKRRSAGLQHTYGLIDSNAPALLELDRFLEVMVLSRSGAICGRLNLSLSNPERKELLKYSFFAGVANKVHFRFSADRLAHLMECWKYA